jgi:hypothetical protein
MKAGMGVTVSQNRHAFMILSRAKEQELRDERRSGSAGA